MQQTSTGLGKWKDDGDPEADEVVHRIEARLGVPFLCELPRVVGSWHLKPPQGQIPDEAWEYLLRPYKMPDWVDPERLRRAQENYRNRATLGEVVLGLYSLPVLYVDPDIALVLVHTGRLVLHVRERLDETREFVSTVMAPGSLDHPGAGWLTIRKVRLMHAVIRRLGALGEDACKPHRPGASFLAVLNAYRVAGHSTGVQLNQVALAFTLLTFSWVMVSGVARLGYPMRPKEADDHIYSWAVIGHMMGIVDDLLPGGPKLRVDDAQRLFDGILGELLAKGDPIGVKVPGAEEGRQLIAALLVITVDLQRETIPSPFREWIKDHRWLDLALQDLPRTLVRRLCGDGTADMLHVGEAPWFHSLICRLALIFINLNDWKLPPATPPKPVVTETYSAGLF
jgi:hypothetical protein